MNGTIEKNQWVTLSTGYARWFAHKNQTIVNYAEAPYGRFKVWKINSDGSYNLKRDGLTLLSVPRHLIIAVDNR